jgi:hypothetical protein
MTTTFKRFQYVNLWTSFQEVKPYDSRTLVYQRKHGSFTYLSYFLTKKIELGLFEAIMFQSTDSNSNNVLPLDVANPIIGVRTLQYGFRYKHNALIGLTAKVNILKQITLYGQLVIDDLKRKSENGNFHNRYGYQAGLKLLEPLRIENLYVLTEYNSVRPFTYSPTIPYQNYSAFNQPLAHPAGNYFKEWVFLARYNYKDLFIQGKIVRYSSSGEQGISQYTPDNAIILEQDFTMDYVSTIITHYNLEGGIIINQKNRLQIAIGTHMMTNSNIAGLPDYVYFAIRTPFSNLYYDF